MLDLEFLKNYYFLKVFMNNESVSFLILIIVFILSLGIVVDKT